MAACTSASLRFDLPAPNGAPIPATAAVTAKLVPKVKGATKATPMPIAAPTAVPVAMRGFLTLRFLAKCSNSPIVCLLIAIGVLWRKALRNLMKSN